MLIDDHPLFVQGLELLLPKISDGRAVVAGSTQDAAGAAGLALRTAADLALVDLHMPAPGGVRAIAAIRRTVPRTRIVAMSGDEHPEPAVEALRAGAEGFLPKTTDAEALLSPLLSILDGWSVLPSSLLGSLLGPVRGNRPAPVHLDDAERRLLRLIAAGATTTEIAEELHVSERTVKRMTATLLRRLRVTSRTEAAALAGSAGLI
ncbi:DNA-binding NarL/FixJ family response regulator [Catenuloplanes nepalensis]|uniref:DNA-binding NarL/FixJ family response regulator n=1 Tax=Catenuloplanes nepalensis TaxID=587533 RepID=A0ABT9MPK7_9ACTN|nr:DNA-binding NarL/FixJ family response regulator [Catenuloplanes nepalensis]